MEEPTSTAIDYNLYENRVIEDRIREYYPQVKALIEMVITKRLKGYKYLFHTAFWFPVSKEYNAERIKILECALEDLERIKREGEPKLPPITEDEPIIY